MITPITPIYRSVNYDRKHTLRPVVRDRRDRVVDNGTTVDSPRLGGGGDCYDGDGDIDAGVVVDILA